MFRNGHILISTSLTLWEQASDKDQDQHAEKKIQEDTAAPGLVHPTESEVKPRIVSSLNLTDKLTRGKLSSIPKASLFDPIPNLP